MVITYKKTDGELEVSETVVESDKFSYGHILGNIAKLESELEIWQTRKVEAEKLGITS